MLEHVPAAIALTFCAAWCAFYLRAMWVVLHIETLESHKAAEPANWPSLSVIVPACNEGGAIREALGSLRDQTYPDLEIIVIDDRSTDDTGQIVDELAAADPRVVAIHVQHLPDGWLGKVHAMHVAVERARGELLLFTDADVHFRADALRRAVSRMGARRLDHLTIIPSLDSRTFWLDAVMSAFGLNLFAGLGIHRMREPGRQEVIGVGAFNLVRRARFDRTPGLEWLRMEVADDTGLAIMLRDAGARQDVWVSHAEVSMSWYASLGAMIRGLEKNLFGIAAKYSLARAVGLAAAGWAFCVGPLLALAAPGGAVGLSALGVVALVHAACAVVASRRTGRPFWSLMAFPLAQMIIVWAMLRSSIIGARRGGIEWRGTRYPLNELRAQQRVDI